MAFPSDLEIARGAALKPLEDIADAMGIASHLLEPHGEEVMKIKLEAIAELAGQPAARYVVVSAITPTPLGEGKTTTTVGLGQGFKHIGKRATVAIRQPSMGPSNTHGATMPSVCRPGTSWSSCARAARMRAKPSGVPGSISASAAQADCQRSVATKATLSSGSSAST